MRLKSLLVATTLLTAFSASAADNISSKKWQPTMELEGRSNSDRSLLYPKLLIPLAQDENSMLFTDLRMRADDAHSEEYNVGLGYRTIQDGMILGGYGYVDHLSSGTNNEYWQATGGLELLTQDWDFRVNGYLPESTEHTLSAGIPSTLTIDAGGNFSLSSGGGLRERALPGVDAEVGYRLPIDFVDMRVFGGFYHFEADGYEDVTGPKARAELTVKHEHWDALPDGVEFTVGAQFQNDGPREGTATGLAQLRIPLGSSSARPKLEGVERRMTNFIERDVDIVAQNGAAPVTTEAASVSVGGRDYTRVAATVDGTTANANAVLNTAGANSFVMFDGANGTIMLTTDGLALLDGQALFGGGSSLTATGLTTHSVLSSTLSGMRPSVSNNGVVTALVSIDGVSGSVTGIDFAGISHTGDAIVIENQTAGQQVSLRDVSISDVNGTGVHINSSNNISIVDTSIDHVVSGISLSNVNGATLSNVSVDTSSGYALTLQDGLNVTGDLALINLGNACLISGTNTGSSVTINGGPGTCP